MANEGNIKRILQNLMYKQECSMVFTDSVLWAGPVVDSPCPSVCVSVILRHLSHVICHMSHITCNVSNELFYNIFSTQKNLILKKIFLFHFLKNETKWLSQLVEGLLSTWPNHWLVTSLVFSEVLYQNGMISWLSI